jgi:hypothetical protein
MTVSHLETVVISSFNCSVKRGIERSFGFLAS